MSPPPDGIIYSLISRREVILCDHRQTQGNFDFTCQEVLDLVIKNGSCDKFSFDQGEYTFHVHVSGTLVYLCVVNSLFDKNVAFNCLFELEQQFISSGLTDRAQSAGPYALRSSFGPTMASVMRKYSSSDVLSRLESKVEDVTGIMRQNIDKAVDRGDALNNLHERSDLLANSSTEFRHSAVKLRKKLCWRNVKMWVILIISLVVLIVVIAVIIICVLAAKGDL